MDSQANKLTDIVNNNKYANYGADTDFTNSVYGAKTQTCPENFKRLGLWFIWVTALFLPLDLHKQTKY